MIIGGQSNPSLIASTPTNLHIGLVLQEECQTSENKTQTQVVGGKEDLFTLVGQNLDLSKMALAL
jgi:hypothetical protein